MFISFFEGRMFSGWIVLNITTARGTLHCRKTRIPFGDQLVICGQYRPLLLLLLVVVVVVVVVELAVAVTVVIKMAILYPILMMPFL
jgi:hypothetical protein